MILRGVDLNVTLTGPERQVRRSGCSEWGGFAVGVSGCLCRWHARPLFDRFGGHGRVWVRAIDMRPPSAAPFWMVWPLSVSVEVITADTLVSLLARRGPVPVVTLGGATLPAGSAPIHEAFSLLGCSGSRGRWDGGEGRSTWRWSGELAVVGVSTMVGGHIFRCVVASLAASRRSPRPRRDGDQRGDRVHGLACHQLAR